MVSQCQIINKILQTKDFSLVSANNFTEDYFFNYKAEFNYIKNHYETYRCVPDKLTFANVFPDFDYSDVNEPDSYLVEQLINDYNTSYMSTSFNTIKRLLENGNTAEAMNFYNNSFKGLNTMSALTCTDLLEDTSRYDHYLERTENPEQYYLSTGFPELDAALGGKGIDRENENMVIIARPGIGKTQILLKMAAAASCQGMRVGIYEGEMTPDKVGYRIDTFLGHIQNRSLNQGDLYVQRAYKEYIDGLAVSNLGPIKVFTPNDVPTGEVTVQTLKTFIEKYSLDILFVDQYDLLDDLHKTQAEHEHVAHIAKDIKKLQVEKKIPIIAVSQMTRAKNEDKDGNKIQDTTQVAGSDKISRYATIIIALDQKADEDTRSIQLTLNIIKARDGGFGKLVYAADFNNGYFNYIPSEKDNVSSQDDFRNISDSYSIQDTQNGGDRPF